MTTSLNIFPTLSPGAARGEWRGMHLIMTLGACEPNLVRDRSALYAYVEKLVDLIDMKAYGGPICERFGTGELAGETVLQLIETSNIDVHGFDDGDVLFLHLFSCKQFNPDAVIAFTTDYFGTDLHESCVIHSHIPEKRNA